MILTTSEAAEELEVTPFAIRKMVERGLLRPAVPGARPLRFRLLDVAEAQVARRDRDYLERHERMVARMLAYG
jgi:DNA-binding transcriptional MerR regulator